MPRADEAEDACKRQAATTAPSPRRCVKFVLFKHALMAGLRTLQAAYLLRLPSLSASATDGAFVPAYRCGAAPDSHRIPFSASISRLRTP